MSPCIPLLLTEHTPFGQLHAHEGTSQVAHTFTGQRAEPTHGLIVFPARAYDPELGRFLQPDPFVQNPADPQTLNRYTYVRNSPVNLVDPSGFGFFDFIKDFFKDLFGLDEGPGDIIADLLPGEPWTKQLVANSINAGYRAYQEDRSILRAVLIEVAATTAEYAVMGSSCAIDLCSTGRAAAPYAGNAIREALEISREVAQNLGVSPKVISKVLMTPVNFQHTFGPEASFRFQTLTPLGGQIRTVKTNLSGLKGSRGLDVLSVRRMRKFLFVNIVEEVYFDRVNAQVGAGSSKDFAGFSAEASFEIVGMSKQYILPRVYGKQLVLTGEGAYGFGPKIIFDFPRRVKIGAVAGLGGAVGFELR